MDALVDGGAEAAVLDIVAGEGVVAGVAGMEVGVGHGGVDVEGACVLAVG